jgi:alanyl-tRNA synthetase
MKALSTDQIRRAFLDFFAARGHAEIASSALIPSNDPTLLFTNAGMVQFKDVFTGKERRDYTRATTAQKCVRAGGKHNDLENVGYTPRHHTFFEMLGNFSFGDYFKKDAIAFAWELITGVLEIPKDRLCVTVFRGEDGIPADDEAADLWAAVGVPRDRIFRLGKKDNFWQMGDTGPQGPCTEIHYFLGDEVPAVVEQDKVERSEGWLEIWNLVFMQFVRETADGPLERLPKPSVDTGAGLERLAMVLQGKRSTYETDTFQRLLSRIAELARKPYGGSAAEDDVSMRVIADHARATAFLIADGVQPSNEGRGYVLRRIMRRAIRHGSRLGFDEVFFHHACRFVIEEMAPAYPELTRAASLIGKAAENEEVAFRRTLDRGLRFLRDELERSQDKALAPAFVADLYDTYGFPIDLTRVIANEQGREVDEEAAQEAVRARQAKSGGQELTKDRAVAKLWFELRDELGATTFAGYASDAGAATVRALVKDGARVSEAGAGDAVEVLLDATPFYGESGGQVGDRGTLRWEDGALQVEDATKPVPELIVHAGKVSAGRIRVGMTLRAEVDAARRNSTRKNHSATHLLHLALKEVLGSHVQQKGSLVAPDRLRFDYSHFEPLTAEELVAIEARVNRMVLENVDTRVAEGSMEDAQKAGATMLFGEKYGDRVRMVRIGGESLELCGGTHVSRSGDIGLFKIVSDAGLASGVRRLEAVTGLGALEWVQAQERLLRQAAGALRASPEQLPERVEKLVKRSKELERELEKAETRAALGGGASSGAGSELEELGGMKVLVKSADGTPKKSLRSLADQLRDQLASGVVILTATEEGQTSLLVAATKDLAGRVDAGAVVKAAVAAMGGSGGGRADFAQGGGPADKLQEGLARARAVIAGA